MSNLVTAARATSRVHWRLSTPWLAVLFLAAAMAYADGFWLTSLQDAIGSVARAQGPFQDWLRVSTVMLPIFAVAVHKALTRGSHRYGPRLRSTRAVVTTALLVVVAGSVVGIGALVANSAYEYNLQANEIELTKATHDHAAAADHAHAACSSTCDATHATLLVHVKGVAYASGLVLATNVLLVGWVVALKGGRLEAPTSRREEAPAAA
jgi:hypothetical protein